MDSPRILETCYNVISCYKSHFKSGFLPVFCSVPLDGVDCGVAQLRVGGRLRWEQGRSPERWGCRFFACVILSSLQQVDQGLVDLGDDHEEQQELRRLRLRQDQRRQERHLELWLLSLYAVMYILKIRNRKKRKKKKKKIPFGEVFQLQLVQYDAMFSPRNRTPCTCHFPAYDTRLLTLALLFVVPLDYDVGFPGYRPRPRYPALSPSQHFVDYLII